MQSCLENFIGVKCLTQNPKSGLWINDLEGINIRMAADIADSNYTSGLQLLEQKIKFATELVAAELSGYVLPYFRINSIIDELLIGSFNDNYLNPTAFDRGVKITTRNSRLMQIRIDSVRIRIQEANYSGTLEIIDGLYSTSFPFVTDSNGEAELFVNYNSKGKEVFIVTDNSAIHPADTDVKTGCACFSKSSEYLHANGWNGSGVASNSFGLIVRANAQCSIDELMCIIAPQIRFAILYKAGLEIVKEAKATDRLNSVTLLDEEKIAFLYEEFSMQYKNHLNTAINALPELFKRVDDICVMCNQSRFVYGTP